MSVSHIDASAGKWEGGVQVNVPELLPDEEIKSCLCDALVELSYVQSVESCTSGLCASAAGKEIIERGMQLLRVKDLSADTLYVRRGASGERLWSQGFVSGKVER